MGAGHESQGDGCAEALAPRPLVVQCVVGTEGGGIAVMVRHIDNALRHSRLASGLLVCHGGSLSRGLAEIEQHEGKVWRLGLSRYEPLLYRVGRIPIPNPVAMLKNRRRACHSHLMLKSLFASTRPDLVVCHSAENLRCVGPACKAYGIPVLYYLHKFMDFSIRGSIRGFREVASINRHATHVVAVSRCAIGGWAQHLRVPFTVIYNPAESFDLARPEQLRGRLGIGPDAVVVGSAGRITRAKGIHCLLNMAALVLRQRHNVHYIIAGTPTTSADVKYLRKLEAQARHPPLGGKVHFVGWVSMGELLNAIDILCHTSCIPESFGLVVAEAMRAGKATVASSFGGPCEILRDGGGILANPFDREALARVVIALVDSPERRGELGRVGMEIARNRFSFHGWRKELLAVCGKEAVAIREKLHEGDGCKSV